MGKYAFSLRDFEDPLDWLIDPAAPTAHLEVLAHPELVVPATGGGISHPVGYPAGAELARILRKLGTEAGADEGELQYPDPRSIADILVERSVIERAELLSRVAEIYAREPEGTSSAIDALLQVRSRRILTFNYDLSLERRADELEIACDSFVLSKDGARVLELLDAEAPRDKLAVIHAHGVAVDPSSIVLDGEGYAQLLEAPYVSMVLAVLVLTSRLLFVGTQLDEIHFLDALLRMRFLKKTQLLVATTKTADELCNATRMPLIPERYRVLLRGYPNTDGTHSELIPLIELLGPPPETELNVAPPTGPMLPSVSGRTPDDYVETLMVEKRDPEEDDFGASYLIALGLRSPIALEQIAAEGTRTLIEGLPGSGKSTLLLEVGARQPRTVVPILLRAPRLDVVGDPTLLLAKWLEAGEGFRDHEICEPERLTREVFHFLIDGLDEVPFARQEQVTGRIVEVAQAHPNHSFSVASRTIPALDAFSRPDWTRVALAQTGFWRAAYLNKREIAWDTLTGAAPLIHDLSGLLELPFFLKHTVDLYERGELAQVGDTLSLVSLFVDAALRDIDETLPAAIVRDWLRRLALAMVLAAKAEVSIGEIASSLPEEFGEFGDTDAVAERLVSASLLRATGEQRYGFVHRIFGEALAAEALRDLDPEESGVLDVAAPIVTDRIQGIRSDWLVPLTLVAATSERWRQALGRRDPLAAARTVPSDAAPEERHEAARLIWNQYVEWRIWLSDYQKMSIVEDESVLARLLATDGLQDLQDEIRTALTADERETVGNAMRVLAALGDKSIEPQLRRILESTEDVVLRRFAAVAARDLGLDSLFFLIAHRAINATDITEAQDATYAARDLATPEGLAELAQHAARKGGEAIRILSHAIRGRVSPTEELAILRAWATHPSEPLQSDRERIVALVASLDVTDPELAEQALYVACSWRVDTESLRRLAREQPDAAARAVASAYEAGVMHSFEGRWILEEIELERLVQINAPAELIEDKERIDYWRREREG